jgi:hypothetical protein
MAVLLVCAPGVVANAAIDCCTREIVGWALDIRWRR